MVVKNFTEYLELGSNISMSRSHCSAKKSGKLSGRRHPRGTVGCIEILVGEPLFNVNCGVRT
jgi:hypothetical protein